MSAENFLHRDRKTGLRMLAGDYLDEILPRDIAFQLSLRKHAEESSATERTTSADSSATGTDIVDLEIFFCDVNCGILASDRKASRCVVVTARSLALFTHGGVLTHKIALEEIKRVELMTTQDDSAAAVLIIMKEAKAPPVVFSFLNTYRISTHQSQQQQQLLRGASAAGLLVVSSGGEHSGRGVSNDTTTTTTTASVASAGSGARSPSSVPAAEEELAASPTSRIAEFRLAIGALSRIRAEEAQIEKVRERAVALQQQTADGNEELLQDQQQDIIANTTTSVNTIVVVSTETAVKLDILLRSLADKAIEQALRNESTAEEVSIPPLEVPRVGAPPPRSAQHDLNLVETLERLCRKERDLSYDDMRDALNENLRRQRDNAGFKSSSQRQGIEAVVEGLNLWAGARQNLISAQFAHQNVQSNLETMLASLKAQHESRNEQVLRLADDAQRVASEHNASIKRAREEVEQIDARIKQIELEMQSATDNYAEAMKGKDGEIFEAKQVVDRMRFELTKGSYSQLPSLHELQTECEKLEVTVAQQSARAEELHISAPDKSVLRHLTLQLEEENAHLQEEILSWKNQRRNLAQQLIAHRMDLSNAEARGDAANKKAADLRRRKVRAEADRARLAESIAKLDKRVESLHLKLRRVELEAVVVEDLKREELMHRSMVQSVRQDIRADLLDKRRVERMMKAEQDRRSKSREFAYQNGMEVI